MLFCSYFLNGCKKVACYQNAYQSVSFNAAVVLSSSLFFNGSFVLNFRIVQKCNSRYFSVSSLSSISQISVVSSNNWSSTNGPNTTSTTLSSHTNSTAILLPDVPNHDPNVSEVVEGASSIRVSSGSGVVTKTKKLLDKMLKKDKEKKKCNKTAEHS